MSNKKSLKQQNKPLTIKEFEWYEVQTKVREIMSELLQPFNKKQTEQSIKMNEFKRNLNMAIKRLDDHDFLLEREDATKPTYLELQDQKIEALYQKFDRHESESISRIKDMEVTIEVYQQKVLQLNNLEAKLDQEISDRISSMQKYRDNIDESVSLMLKKIETQQEENNNLKSLTRTTLQKMENRLIGIDNKLRDNEDEIKRKTQDMRRLLDTSVQQNERILRNQKKLFEVEAKVIDREKDSKLSEKFFAKVKEIENDLLFIHKYLEAYQPLYIQMQISDAINCIVKGRQRRQFCLFEEKKFAKYHSHILEDDATTLQELMSTFSKNISKIINRNKKYIIDLKVQESIKCGTNIYQIRVQDISYNEEEDQSKKTVNMIVPHDEIQKAFDQKWSVMIQDIESKIKEVIEPTNSWIRELQEQFFLRNSTSELKMDEISKGLEDVQNAVKLYEKATDREVSRIGEVSSSHHKKIESLKVYVKDILNFNSILNHIVIQDEIDRQGTALYALKNNNSDRPSPTIQLDPNCLNCSGEGKSEQLIQQMYKMACLTYNPSEIKIDQQYFSREEILELSTNILERLKKKIDTEAEGSTKALIESSAHKIKKSETISHPSQQQRHPKLMGSGQLNKTTMKLGMQTPKRQPSSNNDFSSRSASNSRGNGKGSQEKHAQNLQTLLPALSSTSRSKRTDKAQSSNLTVFY